jgi:hypothetical protein
MEFVLLLIEMRDCMNQLSIFVLIISFANLAFTQEGSFELTCRAKAKEVAAETYKNCVTENKSAQLDQIKKEYQQKLKALKDDYEKELQRLNGKNSAAKPAAAKSNKLVASTKRAQKKSQDDMTIELKPARSVPAPTTDDSTMDLPEPIPVENVPTESSL